MNGGCYKMFSNCNDNKIDIKYDWGPSGNCPVQAEGTINGNKFYFRSRGTGWTLEFNEEKHGDKPKSQYGEWYFKWPDGGWIDEETARKFIEKGAKILLYAMQLE